MKKINKIVLTISLLVITVFSIMTIVSNSRFIIDTYSLPVSYQKYAYILAAAITLAIVALSYVVTTGTIFFRTVTFSCLLSLIVFQIIGVSYARSLSENVETASTNNGVLLRDELESLKKQRDMQTVAMNVCNPAHITKCIMPAQKRIENFNIEIASIIEKLSKKTPSPVQSWSIMIADAFDFDVKNLTTIINIAFSIISELVIIVLSRVALLYFDPASSEPEIETEVVSEFTEELSPVLASAAPVIPIAEIGEQLNIKPNILSYITRDNIEELVSIGVKRIKEMFSVGQPKAQELQRAARQILEQYQSQAQ
jgi:hypothetical protein